MIQYTYFVQIYEKLEYENSSTDIKLLSTPTIFNKC